MTMIERQKNIVNEFAALADWEAKYKRIIELGKKLPSFPEEFQTEQLKVKGCQSQVWLFAKLEADQSVDMVADSDALIVKGLIALLMMVYSGEKASEILKNPPQFIQQIDLGTHLSPSRANGLNSMIKQIMNYALAFEMMAKAKV